MGMDIRTMGALRDPDLKACWKQNLPAPAIL
jgi:hypothetical protein